jgi:hypothetical protein
MIQSSTVRGLAVTAGVLVIASVWVGTRERTAVFTFEKGQLLLPEIDPESVSEVEVKKGAERALLRRAGANFLVESEKNYPASSREVRDLFDRVLGIRLEGKTSEDPDSFATLGVDGGDKTTSIRLADADGKELVTVLVGDALESGGSHVRLAGKNEVFRMEGSIWLRSRGMDFVDKQLLNLQRDDVAKVVVAPAGGKVYTIDSPEKGKVELLDIPAGKKLKGSEHESVFTAASYFNFDNFMPEADAKDMEFANVYTVATRNQSEYRFEIAKQDEKWYLRARAKYTGPESLSVKDASEEQLKKNEELAKAAQAVDAFNQKHQSWVYEIGSWKATSLTKSFEDLLADDDGKPEEVAASHILIPWQGADRADASITRTKEEAKELAEKLLAEVIAEPTKLATLAAEHSSCPSKDKGGDLGTFKFETMAKPFSEAAFALQVGDVCDHIVETGFGFHVIQRTK